MNTTKSADTSFPSSSAPLPAAAAAATWIAQSARQTGRQAGRPTACMWIAVRIALRNFTFFCLGGSSVQWTQLMPSLIQAAKSAAWCSSSAADIFLPRAAVTQFLLPYGLLLHTTDVCRSNPRNKGAIWHFHCSKQLRRNCCKTNLLLEGKSSSQTVILGMWTWAGNKWQRSIQYWLLRLPSRSLSK